MNNIVVGAGISGATVARVLAARAEYKDIHFLGRLGDYKYYDMDKAIARALELVESL